MMFADLTPPDGLAGWLACLAFVAVLVEKSGKMVDRFRGRPSAAEVDQKAAEKYVSKTEFFAHKQGIDEALSELQTKRERDTRDIITKLDEVKTELNSASERRMSEFHRRLDEIGTIAIRAEDRTKHL